MDLTALAAGLLICAHSISASAQFGHGRGPRIRGGGGGEGWSRHPAPELTNFLKVTSRGSDSTKSVLPCL